jgi:hypothetical protein
MDPLVPSTRSAHGAGVTPELDRNTPRTLLSLLNRDELVKFRLLPYGVCLAASSWAQKDGP